MTVADVQWTGLLFALSIVFSIGMFWKPQLTFLRIIAALFWFGTGVYLFTTYAQPSVQWMFSWLAFVLSLGCLFASRAVMPKGNEPPDVDETEDYHEAQREAWRKARGKVGQRE